MRTSSSQPDHTASAIRGFALKGGLFPLTLLELLYNDLADLERELAIKAKQAPGFFNQAPVILSLEHLDEAVEVDLEAIRSLCQRSGLFVVALREAHADINAKARAANLAVLPKSRARTAGHRPTELEFSADPEVSPEPAPGRSALKPATEVELAPPLPDVSTLATVDESGEETSAPMGARLITQPIRSGQQVYAAGGDLVVVAPVSAGAELLADGNIHVYGPLRGRALAGAKGDRDARIFCQQMEAELLSIAGHFKMEEDLSDSYKGKPVQVYLRDHSLHIEALSAKDR